MRCYVSACALVVLLAGSGIGKAQTTREQAQDMRRQIELLEAQLRRIEEADRAEKPDRVTQIGAMRHGHSPEMVVKIYDLSDLFASAPAYEAMVMNELGGQDRPLFPLRGANQPSGMMGGMGGGMFNVPAAKQTLPDNDKKVLAQQMGGRGENESSGRLTIDELISAIQSTIAPDRWDDNGGEGSIARVGTSLLISADRAMHEQIGALLDLFRQRWRTLRTVTVVADWVWLSPARLRTLIPAPRELPVKDASRLTTPIIVDTENWQQLLSDEKRGQGKRVDYNAAVTCYNGQTVFTQSGAQSLEVINIEPVIQPAEKDKPAATLGFRPVVEVLQEGAALQVTPVATTNARYVVLDLRTRVAILDEIPGKTAADRAAAIDGKVIAADQIPNFNLPRIVAQRLSTTLRVPVDRTVLVGGMTFDNRADDAPGLYLFVRTEVHELRDDPAGAVVARGEPSERPNRD